MVIGIQIIIIHNLHRHDKLNKARMAKLLEDEHARHTVAMSKHAITLALLRDVISKGMGIPNLTNDDVLRLAKAQPRGRDDPPMDFDQMHAMLRQPRPK